MRIMAYLAAMACAGVLAQTPTPAPPVEPPLVPVIDPAKALTGAALLDALRKGGYVLLMRHSRQAGPQEEVTCTRPNLSPEGAALAKKIGEALHDRKVPIGAVLASRYCRAIETARLLEFGDPEVTDDLNITSGPSPLHAARAKRLAQPPRPGTNTMLVSHGHGSPDVSERVFYELCEIIVYRPDGKGGSEPVARIKPEDWDALR